MPVSPTMQRHLAVVTEGLAAQRDFAEAAASARSLVGCKPVPAAALVARLTMRGRRPPEAGSQQRGEEKEEGWVRHHWARSCSDERASAGERVMLEGERRRGGGGRFGIEGEPELTCLLSHF